MKKNFKLKKSIAVRLFIRIVAVLALFIAIALIANTLFLKPVYNAKKKKDLLEAVEKVNFWDGDYGNNLAEILKIEEQLSARIIIFEDNNIIYMTAARLFQGELLGGGRGNQQDRNNEDSDFVPGHGIKAVLQQFVPREIQSSKTDEIDDKTTFTRLIAARKSEYYIVESVLDDGSNMMIVAQMQSLTETVRIFNLFLLGTAGVSLIIIIFMTYFMSKKFVEPIKNMNRVTKQISELDFDSSCEVNTNDELEELANSINTLSGSLETTISDLKEELKKAKRLDELRRRFVATVSHELKTPIALMQGYSIGLASDVCQDKERRDYYAQVIAEESERLGLLVNELMDLTQLEAGYIVPKETDFEVNEFLVNNAEKFSAAHPGLDIEVKSALDEVWGYGDIKLINRVIGNYLSNAVRHTDDKNKIIIDVKPKDNYYEVTVMNYGQNIPEDKINEIWNSFYRVDDARSRADGGHGLGLSIVKNIQTAHKMPYGVRNVEGGVEFSFGIKMGKNPELI